MKILNEKQAAEIKKALAEDCVEQGLAMLNDGQLEDSINEFTKAIDFDPDNAAAIRFRNLALAKLRNLENARQNNTANQVNPQISEIMDKQGFKNGRYFNNYLTLIKS